MNKAFLYTKPHVLGVIDDSDDDTDTWFLDTSRQEIEQFFARAPFEELVVELVHIMRDGEPNYQVLTSLLGETRSSGDIQKVEMELIEEGTILSRLILFLDAASFHEFNRRVTCYGEGISSEQVNDQVVISVRNKTIEIRPV
ncbi:hypothetical protein [Gorillibacterium sp. CAU 1737]|uniref:hypothetical protein n=1 Tax=Gorillibacterium sp. CAU 1737 TaxID=3140362 RepID=UPI0032619077